MSEDLAFIAEILAAPNDDAPRLIYADWLEEQGNPRGEFIRGQIELENLPQDEPRYFELSDRTEELLKQHEEEWRAPPLNAIRKAVFHRGFIDTITLKARDVPKRLRTIRQATPVRTLRLNYIKGASQKAAESEELAHVTGLDLSGLTVPESDLAALLASPYWIALQELDLSNQHLPLEEEVGAAIANSVFARNLRTLSASSYEPQHGFFQAIAQQGQLPELRTLRIGHYYSGSQFASLKGLQAPQLENIQVRGNLSSTDVKVLCTLVGNLKHLDLSDTHLEANGIKKLHDSGAFQQIEKLSLCSDEITDAELAPLFEPGNLSHCTELDLSTNELTGETLRRVTNCDALKNVERLRLNNLHTDEQSLLEFFHVVKFDQLTELALRHVDFTPRTVEALGSSSIRETLRTLNFDGCLAESAIVEAFSKIEFPQVTRASFNMCDGLVNEGFIELLKANALPNLRELNLNHTPCTPLMLHALGKYSGFPELRTIAFFGGTTTTEATLAVLNSEHRRKLKRLALHSVTGMKNRPRIKREVGDRFVY